MVNNFMQKNLIKRRNSRVIKIGSLKIGGCKPILIQSMVKSDTCDIKRVVSEIKGLEKAGCEIVRVAIKNIKDANAIKKIKSKISIPLVADVHFSPHLAIEAIKNGADKIRLNPGNIKDKEGLEEIVKVAKKRKVPVRIGVNSGSVDRSLSKKDNEVESFIKSIKGYLKIFEAIGFYDIILSAKSSDVLTTIAAYRAISRLCDYPLHLGITASGPSDEGIVKSAVGIGTLLSEGIGDTIRVSLTDESVNEVYAAKIILKSLNLRNFGPEILSCPTCGRCKVDLVSIVNEFNERLKASPRFKRKELKVAIMGCVVNGPGEAKEADLGIAAGIGSGILFRKGKKIKTIKESEFINTLLKELERI